MSLLPAGAAAPPDNPSPDTAVPPIVWPESVRIGTRVFRFPYADVLPHLSPEEFAGLRDAIQAAGRVIVPVVTDEYDNVIDGMHRLVAASQLRLPLVRIAIERLDGMTPTCKLEWALMLNGNRRHLSAEGRQDAARRIAADTNWSHRRIAACLGVHSTTVDRWLATDGDGALAPAPACGSVEEPPGAANAATGASGSTASAPQVEPPAGAANAARGEDADLPPGLPPKRPNAACTSASAATDPRRGERRLGTDGKLYPARRPQQPRPASRHSNQAADAAIRAAARHAADPLDARCRLGLAVLAALRLRANELRDVPVGATVGDPPAPTPPTATEG